MGTYFDFLGEGADGVERRVIAHLVEARRSQTRISSMGYVPVDKAAVLYRHVHRHIYVLVSYRSPDASSVSEYQRAAVGGAAPLNPSLLLRLSRPCRLFLHWSYGWRLLLPPPLQQLQVHLRMEGTPLSVQ
jgi:hypothetical protein